MQVVYFKVARLQVLKLGRPQCTHDLYWFFKAVGNGHDAHLTTSYWGLKHFRNLRSERSPAKYVAKADAEVSSWFLWMSSMLRVYPSSKTLATRSGFTRPTASHSWQPQVTRSDALVHRIEALQTLMLPWDRPKVKWWAEIRSVNKHDLNLLAKDMIYFWWCFISIGPRVAPAAFMKCFQGVHEGLWKKCWLRSSISITVFTRVFMFLHL